MWSGWSRTKRAREGADAAARQAKSPSSVHGRPIHMDVSPAEPNRPLRWATALLWVDERADEPRKNVRSTAACICSCSRGQTNLAASRGRHQNAIIRGRLAAVRDGPSGTLSTYSELHYQYQSFLGSHQHKLVWPRACRALFACLNGRTQREI